MKFTEYFEFQGTLSYLEMGRMGFRVVFLPESVIQQLPLEKYPRLRVEVEIGDVVSNQALHPKNGKWYLLFSKKLLAETGLEFAESLEIRLSVADQDFVDVPEELMQAVAQDKELKRHWEQLTPGARRSHAHRVGSAKTKPTRLKRVEEVKSALLMGS